MSFVINGIEARKYLESSEFANSQGRVYLGWKMEMFTINLAREENTALALPLILKSIISAGDVTLWSALIEDQKGTTLELKLGTDMNEKYFFAGTDSKKSIDEVNMYNSLAYAEAMRSDIPTLNRP